MLHGAGGETPHEGRLYARHFAGKGTGAPACDKRASGESGGEDASATYEDLAADAPAAVKYLRSGPEFDDESIGLEGTSEGGWVAPVVAARDGLIAFVIVISATAESPAEQVRYGVGENVRRAGHGADIAAAARNL